MAAEVRMKTLYFSSTGNCLYVAKRLGGTAIPLAPLLRERTCHVEDDAVGVVFPIYGLCIPPIIEEFLQRLQVESDYLFAVATYGFFPGAVCSQLWGLQLANGRTFDYVNRLKMAENCITFADMAKQRGDSPKKEKALDAIARDITTRRHYARGDSPLKRVTTAQHAKNYEYPTGIGITDEITVSEACTGCGTCARICPLENISIADGRPHFDTSCMSCGGCLQNCPAGAIHHNREKSAARYRNPHVAVSELFIR